MNKRVWFRWSHTLLYVKTQNFPRCVFYDIIYIIIYCLGGCIVILKKIILEGDSNYEKEHNLFPIRWKSHHLTELFMELCPKLDLDGNGKLTIFATRNRRENAKKYNNYKEFHVSSYYLEEEQIKNLELLDLEEAENYILDIIEQVLTDIIERNSGDEEKNSIIKATVNQILEEDFSLKKKIKILSKKENKGKYNAEVFRCLDKKLGEAWCVEIHSGTSSQTRVEWLTSRPDYLDRRDYFKKSKWEDNKFVLTDRLGADIAAINVEK